MSGPDGPRPGSLWREGWYGYARRLPSPNVGPRPQGAAVDLIVVHSISLPPGQYDVGDRFPVLSAGPTPRTPLTEWDVSVQGELDGVRRWSWEEFRALPREAISVHIHCVTKWSKFDTRWEGV